MYNRKASASTKIIRIEAEKKIERYNEKKCQAIYLSQKWTMILKNFVPEFCRNQRGIRGHDFGNLNKF